MGPIKQERFRVIKSKILSMGLFKINNMKGIIFCSVRSRRAILGLEKITILGSHL